MNAPIRSRQLFDSGLFCAESVLQAVAEHYQIRSELIPKIATGFCSGLARTKGTCGAVSGGILAINLLSGRNTPEQSIEKNYIHVQNFLKKFMEKYKSITCPELIPCDISTLEGLQQFRALNLIETCKQIVEMATAMVLEELGGQTGLESHQES
jgi:C_GCAxxG_C_C family probable redox protein